MDASYFALGLIGALVGYIVGDLQRELRWRRDARENLRLAVDRFPVTDTDTNGAGTGTNGHSDADGGPAWTLRSVRDGQARRRAISRADYGPGSAAALRGRRARGTDAQTVGAGYDCG